MDEVIEQDPAAVDRQRAMSQTGWIAYAGAMGLSMLVVLVAFLVELLCSSVDIMEPRAEPWTYLTWRMAWMVGQGLIYLVVGSIPFLVIEYRLFRHFGEQVQTTLLVQWGVTGVLLVPFTFDKSFVLLFLFTFLVSQLYRERRIRSMIIDGGSFS
jgi:hypothetical protein